MLIDFHTHTTASDGALDPVELLNRARESGVELLAITDHDTLAGYEAAATYCVQNPGGARLVPGVELSCIWSGTTIHVLGLGIDCQHPAMVQGMEIMSEARQLRGEEIARRLATRGFEGGLEGAREKAGASQLGRPHFADWLVEQGHVKDHNQAFNRYLGQGKIGDVKTCWPAMDEIVGWINEAGGTAVIAHPLKYRFTRMKLRRLVVDFVESGGSAIEVHSGRQTSDQIDQIKRLARDFDLAVSVGSDFHREAPYAADLGVESSGFEDMSCVWEKWAGERGDDRGGV